MKPTVTDFSDERVLIFGDDFGNYLSGVDNNDSTLIGMGGDDVLIGGAGRHGDGVPILNFLDGGFGNDFLIGGAGYNTLVGSDGNDTLLDIHPDSLGVYADGGAGNDYLRSDSRYATLLGSDGNDTLVYFGTGIALLDGNGGNNVLANAGGGDVTYMLRRPEGADNVQDILLMNDRGVDTVKLNLSSFIEGSAQTHAVGVGFMLGQDRVVIDVGGADWDVTPALKYMNEAPNDGSGDVVIHFGPGFELDLVGVHKLVDNGGKG